MKKYVKLYDVTALYPIWFLLLMPNTWIFLIATQFILASFVLLGGLKYMEYEDVSSVWKKTIIWNTLYGFIGYPITCGILFATQFISETMPKGEWLLENLTTPLATNPFSHLTSAIFIIVVVAFSAFISYIMNRFFSFKRTNLNKSQINRLSIYLAIITAPYITMIPSVSLYNALLK